MDENAVKFCSYVVLYGEALNVKLLKLVSFSFCYVREETKEFAIEPKYINRMCIYLPHIVTYL
jgi:hypothetical protein